MKKCKNLSCDNVLTSSKQLYCSESCGNKYRLYVKQQSKDTPKRNCNHCNVEFYPRYTTNIYCSRKCSASITNKNKPKDVHAKRRASLIKRLYNMSLEDYCFIKGLDIDEVKVKKISTVPLKPKKPPVFKAEYELNPKKCTICGNKLSWSKRNMKTCGKTCYTKLKSIQGTDNLRKRRLSGEEFSFRKQSKLEKKFYDYLIGKGIQNNRQGFLTEVYMRKPNTCYHYRLDFVFPKLKLVIEVDGKQHELPKQQKKDIIRDYYIGERGWNVLRINYYEVNKVKILDQIFDQYLKVLI